MFSSKFRIRGSYFYFILNPILQFESFFIKDFFAEKMYQKQLFGLALQILGKRPICTEFCIFVLNLIQYVKF
jgi:hypothetical protein